MGRPTKIDFFSIDVAKKNLLVDFRAGDTPVLTTGDLYSRQTTKKEKT
jgi:hypothetical protein